MIVGVHNELEEDDDDIDDEDEQDFDENLSAPVRTPLQYGGSYIGNLINIDNKLFFASSIVQDFNKRQNIS